MSAILKQKLIDIANGFTKYGLWKGGGSSALSELDDVTLTNLQKNDVLTYNGSVWVNDDNLQKQIDTLNSNLENKLGNTLVLYVGWDNGAMDIILPKYGLYLVTVHHNYYGDPTFIVSSGNNANVSSKLVGMTNAGSSINISIQDNGDKSIKIVRNWSNYATVRVWKI